MITWTDPARETLDRHFTTIRSTLLAGGIDPETVAVNLRRKIEDELTGIGSTAVSREDVERVLAGQKVLPPTHPATSSSAISRTSLLWGGRAFSGFFGVILPLITLVLEFLSGMCAEFFDPIPTVWHIAAIAIVPLANALALYATIAEHLSSSRLRWIIRLNSFALGIAAFYALWFVPMTPFALIGILFFGFGLLPLSPLLSLLFGLLLRQGLRRKTVATGQKFPSVWRGLMIGFACLVAMELPGAFQAWAIDAVVHGDGAQQGRALWFLRHAGNEQQLLRSCYANPDAEREAVLHLIFGQTSQTDRRQVYYRVTGRNFNSVPAPSHTLTLFGRGADRGSQDWVWDNSQGADQVGERLKYLDLKESRIDGTVDGDAALGYLEWTMVFRNDHEFQQREARALVQLPSGAVVSRLTLWIDGEEREAAFGGRGQVRQAYQAVVNQRRDPVLVTAKGPDRVLVQCFPIPAKGGEMKIRIGITVPLAIDQLSAGRLVMPRIIEQNFSAAPGLSHAVWIESKSALTSGLAAYRSDTLPADQFTVRGSLTPAQFASPAASLMVARNPTVTDVWGRDPRNSAQMITQEITPQTPPPAPLAVVIDGSSDLAASANALADTLEAMPAGFNLSLLIASDTVLTCPVQGSREVAVWLRAQLFTGGQDASAALRVAYDSLTAHGGSLLWIHGTQPMTWGDTTVLEQALTRRVGPVHLFALPAIAGANVLLERLGEFSDFSVLPRFGEPKADLGFALNKLRNGGFAATRRAVGAENFVSIGKETTASLARLWAADEVARLLGGKHPQRDAAISLATSHHLVTAVTGAVVLETKQQYDAAGLTPGDSEIQSASVPDTGMTLVLLVLGLGILSFFAHYRNGGKSVVTGPA